ncbi:putative toxin-antitoxin system antitoxin component (TIGR02293 family) [Azospirillum brasilense]|uniref:Putative toxin-antitoxin system antitoxin component (TIGR02293 family) n=1 Tax=Azospirillum brasilense TaxID=192 RepID=A0A560B8G3_AZOBR|nr:antitoxin Xre/MbcA/ParS toxin-binding domain-containing protein [Azospirillum brasilense]TWA68884.1 putative toxin-antitoxin system antitoxin component (TIGR02293 family) [Azospirillum brasilense]
MLTHQTINTAISNAQVVTKAVLRAADQLDIPNTILAKILGVSEPTVSRMRKHGLTLSTRDKSFELAILFIRLYRSLDAIVGGDPNVARAWLRNVNTALDDSKPLDKVQTITGLMHVIDYLDSRRAVL